MNDPLEDIENAQAQRDLGIFGARVFMGALQELDGDIFKTYLVTVSFFRGMFASSHDDPTDDNV